MKSKCAVLVFALLVALPTLAAGRGPELRGTVYDAEDKPIPGVEIVLTAAAHPDLRLTDTTDKKGKFKINVKGGGTGEYQVRAEKEGYAPLDSAIALTEGEWTEARFQLVDAASGARGAAIATFNEGAKLYEAGDKEAARVKFLAAIEQDPQLAAPHLAMADIYLTEGDAAAAAQAAETYLTLEPGEIKGLRLAYEAYRRLGDREKAAATLEGLRGTPHIEALAADIYNEGVYAARDGNSGLAIERFRTAIELDPTLVEGYSGLATLLYNAEDYEGAMAAIDQLLERDPQNVQGLRVRYLVHDARNEPTQAAAAFTAYQAVDPERAMDLLYERAALDFSSGETAAARDALLRILATDPDHPQAHYTLGLVYASEDPVKAKEHLQRFLALAPDDPEAATAREMLQHL